jgi:hypothetical protein
MDRNDQQAIEQLFGKLAAVERQMPQRDGDAEAFIRDQIAAQPGAPYYMAQTIVMQEQALQGAQARIEELEAQAAAAPRQSGGLFGSLFGSSAPAPRRSGAVPSVNRAAPAQANPMAPQHPAARGGGGFLAGAAQTAMGVAGGVLLGNAIAGMLGGGATEAHAADAGAAEDVGVDDAGFDDGGDFGDMDF